MIRSRLSKAGRTTIPKAVREALGLREGDAVAYLIQGDRVIIRRTTDEAADGPFASFGEWDSAADRIAYADL